MSSDGMMLFVGLEIGGTNLKAGILDGETGKLIGSFRQEPLLLPKGSLDYVGPEAVIDQLVALGQSAMDEQDISWPDALYIGVACPGQIDREAGSLVAASTFPAWRDVPLAAMVQDRTGRPVTVLNDASAAASAEFAGRGSHETIAVLTLGTGIGLGVVSAGRVVTGSRGLIEGGHMIVEPGPDSRPCPCGQRGCLEAYASASAVAAIASERMRNRRSRQMSPKNVGRYSPSRGDRYSPSPVRSAQQSSPKTGGGYSPSPASRKSFRGDAQSAPVFPRRRSVGGPVGSPSGVGKRIRELERRSSTDERIVAPFASPSRKGSLSPRGGYGVGGFCGGDGVGGGVGGGGGVDVGDGGGGGGAMTAVDVVSMARRGDEVAMGVFEEACVYIGLACVNICRLVDPDVILLAGGLSNADGLVEKVREAFDSRGWSILPHECEIGLASACASGSSGVVGAAGAAACEFALAARRLSKAKSPSRSRKSPAAAHISGSPCEGVRDSSAAATEGATDAAGAADSAGAAGAAADAAAGETGRAAVEGYGRANANGSPAGAERHADRSAERGPDGSADKGMSGSDPREQKPAGAPDLANGVVSRGMVDDAAVSEEVFVRAKPEGYYYGGIGGGGAQRQGGGGWKSFAAGVGFGAAAAALGAAVATSVKAGRVRFR